MNMALHPSRAVPSAFTFSLRQLLVWMGVIAMGCVALRSASTIWVAVMLGLALLTMTAAILFAVFRQGAERAYWIGFATFGWMYLLLLYSGWSLQTNDAPETPLRPHNILTSRISSACYHWLYDAAFAKYFASFPSGRYGGGMGGMGGGFGSGGFGSMGGSPARPPAPGPNEGDFVNVAHALWTLLLAAFGGLLAQWLSSSRKGNESRTTAGALSSNS